MISRTELFCTYLPALTIFLCALCNLRPPYLMFTFTCLCSSPPPIPPSPDVLTLRLPTAHRENRFKLVLERCSRQSTLQSHWTTIGPTKPLTLGQRRTRFPPLRSRVWPQHFKRLPSCLQRQLKNLPLLMSWGSSDAGLCPGWGKGQLCLGPSRPQGESRTINLPRLPTPHPTPALLPLPQCVPLPWHVSHSTLPKLPQLSPAAMQPALNWPCKTITPQPTPGDSELCASDHPTPTGSSLTTTFKRTCLPQL